MRTTLISFVSLHIAAELLDLAVLAEEPTMEPTSEPTAAPSNPSVAPSIAPSMEPTAEPTTPTITFPTKNPTRVPTSAPSKQSMPLLTFDSIATIGGATSNTLDLNGQMAVVNATATSMGISQNDVTFKGSVATAETRRRMTTGMNLFTTTYTIVTTTGVTVLVTTGSSEDLYTALSTAIETAVATGQFTTNLQRAAVFFNFPALANANVTSAANTDPVVENPSSGSDDPVLDDGAIAGIVIGGFFFLVIVAALIYLYFSKADTTKVKVVDSETEMLNVQP